MKYNCDPTKVSVLGRRRREKKPRKLGYVYVLALDLGKFYVGWTAHLRQRIKQHFDGDGARWTQLYPPIEVIETFRGTKDDERQKTLELVCKFGKRNVRGGPWCAIRLMSNRWPV